MGMYEHLRRFRQVLPVCGYERTEDLPTTLAARVIAPAVGKAEELKPPAAQ